MIDGEIAVTSYFVSKMKCDGCIKSASDALMAIPGFENVKFDLKEGTAEVQGKIDPQSICQALGEAGYPAVVKSK